MKDNFNRLIDALTDEYYLSDANLTIEFDSKKDYMVTYRVHLYLPEMLTRLETIASLFEYNLGIHTVKINNGFETEFIFFKN